MASNLSKPSHLSSILGILCLVILANVCPLKLYAQENGRETRYVNPTGDQFPIWAWKSFFQDTLPPDSCFRFLKEAGCNIGIQIIDTDTAMMADVLNRAKAYDLKMVFGSSVIGNMNRLPATVTRLRGHSNLLGYYIYDEPPADKFELCREYKDLIHRYDPTAISFFNLVACWGDTGKSMWGFYNMKAYAEAFVKTVDPYSLSVDVYPVRTNGGLHILNRFYATYEDLSEVSRESGIPFWAVMDAVALEPMQWPDETNMRFAAFVALGYGAQSIIWWSYTLPTTNGEEWKSAPMMPGNLRTPIWFAMRNVNQEIQALRGVFLGSQLKGVWHTGNNLPYGTRRLGTLPLPFTSLTAGREGVMVSHLTTDGREYLVIVNHDVAASQQVRLRWNGNNVRRVNPDGTEQPARNTHFTIAPGSYLILRF